MYYTYAYLREDKTPYYIGMGKGNRINKPHIRGVADIRPPKDRRLYLKQNISREEAIQHEIYMIDILGRKDRGGILINLTGGGDGNYDPTDENRLKNSIRNKKENNPFWGKTHSDKTKDKLRTANSSWYRFTHKDGRELTLHTTLVEFCKEHNLDRKSMSRVLNKKPHHNTCGGWKVQKLD